MLPSEFISRVRYIPTAEEWEVITESYNEFPGDKDAFCAAWCKLYPTKAGQIDREAFEVIAAKFNRLTFKFDVFKLKDWHGITAGWSCEMWRNYWALHSACAYFG